MGFDSYSTTPASNTSLNGINVAEGCPPSGINDALRQIAADGASLFSKAPTYQGTSTGSTNAYALATPAIAAYVTGAAYRFLTNFTNTASATLNINALGAKTITRWDGSALAAGDLMTGSVADVLYDGTNFRLLTQTTGGVNPQTGTTYTVIAGDRGRMVTLSNASAIAVTLPQATTSGFGAGWYATLASIGAGLVTITPATSTIDGAASLTLGKHQAVALFSDGTNYFTNRGRAYDYILIQDIKAQGNNGQSLSAATWTTRTLTNTVTDTTGAVSLASNQFVLPAGTYEVTATAPIVAFTNAGNCNSRIRLFNATASTTLVIGSLVLVTQGSGTSYNSGECMLRGRFTVAASQSLQVDQWASVANVGGFAMNTASFSEYYTTVELRRVSG